MPITRAQAQVLLNVGEMQLYDDSRANGVRKLDASALHKRVERARRARDRARDLVQRQKLASRERTGSKRGTSGVANQRSKQKAELLADILKRFETALKAAGKAATATTARASSARKTVAGSGSKSSSRGATRVAVRRSAGDTAAAPARSSASKTTGKTAKKAPAAPRKRASSTAAGAGPAQTPRKRASKTTRKASPPSEGEAAGEQRKALRATRTLLKQKTERDRAPAAWQALDSAPAPVVPAAGYQSASAARKSRKLHAAESRMVPINASLSAHDRRNQGRRDRRGSGED